MESAMDLAITEEVTTAEEESTTEEESSADITGQEFTTGEEFWEGDTTTMEEEFWEEGTITMEGITEECIGEVSEEGDDFMHAFLKPYHLIHKKPAFLGIYFPPTRK
jgi:hypothetical protein